MKCCLIGETLKHSLSKPLHNKMGGYSYELVEVAKEKLNEFVALKEFDAYNVTIPYKSQIIPMLDEVSDLAKQIGAVNTVVTKNGKLYGFNTDFYGMRYLIRSAGFDFVNKKIMILGSGATSKTAKSVSKSLGASEVYIVSRMGEINYENCHNLKVDYIINTTPVGTYPNQDASPIELSKFKNILGVVDVVYNPLKTKLMFDVSELNIKSVGGLKMLVAQAKYARDLFLGNEIVDTKIDEVIEKLYLDLVKETENLVLIGMAGCGKSTLGKLLASSLNKNFVDTDQLIEEKVGITIPEIFEKYGEERFREIESDVLKETSLLRNTVIATGGGVVVKRCNKFLLKCCAKVVWLKRDLEKLEMKGRPLYKSSESKINLYKERESLYNDFADIIVLNNDDINNTLKKVVELCEY